MPRPKSHPAGSPLASREKLRLVTERADALLVEAQQLGFSLEHVKKLLDKRYAAMSAKGRKTASGNRHGHSCRNQ